MLYALLLGAGHSSAGTIEAYDEVLLLDTATGRTWIYEPSLHFDVGEGKDKIAIPAGAHFVELTVDGIHGSHEDDVKRAATLADRMREDVRIQSYCAANPVGFYGAVGSPNGVACPHYLTTHTQSNPQASQSK